MGYSPHMNRIDYSQILDPKTGAPIEHRALHGQPPSSFAVGKLRASRCGMGTKGVHRKGKSYGVCMEFVWSLYGTCMELVWNLYGTCMELVWNLYGIRMEYVWNNTPATRLPRAVGGLAAIDLSDGGGRDTLHCRNEERR